MEVSQTHKTFYLVGKTGHLRENIDRSEHGSKFY